MARLRFAPRAKRFDVTYGEVALFGILIALMLVLGVRDWVAVRYLTALSDRLAVVEKAIAPLEAYLAQAGTVAPADVLRETQASRKDLSDLRVVGCAILIALRAHHRLCPEVPAYAMPELTTTPQSASKPKPPAQPRRPPARPKPRR